MRNFHKRVVTIDYCSDDLPVGNQEEFHRALGRAVAYGMRNLPEQDTVQLVTVALDSRGNDTPEIGAAYWAAKTAYTVEYRNMEPYFRAANDAVSGLKSDRPQIYICGVPDAAAGKYGFHS